MLSSSVCWKWWVWKVFIARPSLFGIGKRMVEGRNRIPPNLNVSGRVVNKRVADSSARATMPCACVLSASLQRVAICNKLVASQPLLARSFFPIINTTQRPKPAAANQPSAPHQLALFKQYYQYSFSSGLSTTQQTSTVQGSQRMMRRCGGLSSPLAAVSLLLLLICFFHRAAAARPLPAAAAAAVPLQVQQGACVFH